MLTVGLTGTQSLTVTPQDTAAVHKSGTLEVFATPAMAALMEETAWKMVAPLLQPEETTVGIALELRHLAPTPVGMTVRCEATLVEVDRRRLVFDVAVYDEKEKIGEGKHQRFIVDSRQFAAKAAQKKG